MTIRSIDLNLLVTAPSQMFPIFAFDSSSRGDEMDENSLEIILVPK